MAPWNMANIHDYVSVVLFSSVQLKMISMHLGKPSRAHHPISQKFPQPRIQFETVPLLFGSMMVLSHPTKALSLIWFTVV